MAFLTTIRVWGVWGRRIYPSPHTPMKESSTIGFLGVLVYFAHVLASISSELGYWSLGYGYCTGLWLLGFPTVIASSGGI